MGTINDTLIKAMKEVAQGTVDKAGFDKTRNCMIMSTANANNTYTVNMDGRDYDNIPCYGGGSFNIGDVTKIYIPNNQMSQAYIEKIVGGSGSATWGSITGTLANQTDLQTALNAKQATISDLNTIRSGASAGATAYQKPASGIPDSDIASASTWSDKSEVSVSATGTSTDEVQYITIDGTEKKLPSGGSGGDPVWGDITGTLSNQTDLQDELDDKQDTLVSGTNIKTINSTSLLGSGNITTGDLESFVYDYETTSFDDLKAAIDADKVIYVHHAYVEEPEEGETPEYAPDMLACYSGYGYYNTTLVLTCVYSEPIAMALGVPGSIIVVYMDKNSTTQVVDKGCVSMNLSEDPNETASSASSNDKFIIKTGALGATSKKISIDNVKTYILNNLALSSLVDDSTHRLVTDTEKATWNAKSTVSVSSTGTSTDEVQYITIDGTEKKLPSGVSPVWGNITGTLANQTDLQDELDDKQDTLVSGTNIKTVNNTSILGSGNIDAKDIFTATYNTTSYADVLSAYNAGKYIVADYYNQKFALLTYDNNQFIFSFLYGAVTSSTIGQLNGGLITLESSGWDSSFGSCTPYQKPSSGIPKTDLASAVQTSLGLADTALQTHQSLSAYRTSSAQDVIDSALEDDIDALETSVSTIEGKIPPQASSSNQLADKDFVDSSISTSTATFRGISATGLTEAQFLTWANSLTKDNNDYVFWNTEDSVGNVQFKRYKYNGTSWVYEYTLNNSSFTSAQWATIQSGLTSSDKTKLNGIEAGADVTDATNVASAGAEMTANKVTSFQATPDNTHYPSEKLVKDSIDAKYTKPSSGIPDSDLAEAHYTESEADTLLAGKANTSHTQTLSTITDVTATASEVNVLDGVTATTSEINLLDGKTSNNLRKITVSTTDIGVGGNLTTGELYFVYEA